MIQAPEPLTAEHWGDCGRPESDYGLSKPKRGGQRGDRREPIYIRRTMYGITDNLGTAMQTATERLEMRLPPEDKILLARAAQIEGVRMAQFVLGPAMARARKVVAQAKQVGTTAKGYRDLLDALAKPPKPTKALIAAMRDYESAGIQWR